MAGAIDEKSSEALMLARLEKAREKAAKALWAEKYGENTTVEEAFAQVWEKKIEEAGKQMDEDIPVHNMWDEILYPAALRRYARCKQALEKGNLKLARKIIRHLEPTLTSLKAAESSSPVTQELPRDAYELAVVINVLDVDHDEFERNFSLLRPYYTDGRVCAAANSSERKYALLRLYLLRFLLHNGIADFQTELESLSAAYVRDDFSCVVDCQRKMDEDVLTAKRVLDFLALRKSRRYKTSGSKRAEEYQTFHDECLAMCRQLVESMKKEHPEWEWLGCFFFHKGRRT